MQPVFLSLIPGKSVIIHRHIGSKRLHVQNRKDAAGIIGIVQRPGEKASPPPFPESVPPYQGIPCFFCPRTEGSKASGYPDIEGAWEMGLEVYDKPYSSEARSNPWSPRCRSSTPLPRTRQGNGS